jgi:hypothetical protein
MRRVGRSADTRVAVGRRDEAQRVQYAARDGSIGNCVRVHAWVRLFRSARVLSQASVTVRPTGSHGTRGVLERHSMGTRGVLEGYSRGTLRGTRGVLERHSMGTRGVLEGYSEGPWRGAFCSLADGITLDTRYAARITAPATYLLSDVAQCS